MGNSWETSLFASLANKQVSQLLLLNVKTSNQHFVYMPSVSQTCRGRVTHVPGSRRLGFSRESHLLPWTNGGIGKLTDPWGTISAPDTPPFLFTKQGIMVHVCLCLLGYKYRALLPFWNREERSRLGVSSPPHLLSRSGQQQLLHSRPERIPVGG